MIENVLFGMVGFIGGVIFAFVFLAAVVSCESGDNDGYEENGNKETEE